jgi:hypothetical protein
MIPRDIGFQAVNEVSVGVTIDGQLLRDVSLFDFVNHVLNDPEVRAVIQTRMAFLDGPKQECLTE